MIHFVFVPHLITSVHLIVVDKYADNIRYLITTAHLIIAGNLTNVVEFDRS